MRKPPAGDFGYGGECCMSIIAEIREPALVTMSALWVTASATGVPASAHDAPKGWTYPYACCSGYDCREVTSKAISEHPEGYVIKGTGEVVAYNDKRLRTSPDGEFHRCSVAGADDTRTICLFVPPRSF
jgi:hypothetical protein